MNPLLFILFLLTATCSFGQMTLQDIENKEVVKRIEFIKSKTDSFLLSHFNKKTQQKFHFEFLNCGYFRGEFRSIYQFFNSDKPAPHDLDQLNHNYSFHDKDIDLKTDINVWFSQVEHVEMAFQSVADSLKYIALNRIYNKGLIQRLKKRIADLKLRHPYTIIQINEKTRTLNIILKDKSLPHNYFVQ